jgi:hypothetical protein
MLKCDPLNFAMNPNAQFSQTLVAHPESETRLLVNLLVHGLAVGARQCRAPTIAMPPCGSDF